MALPKRFHVKSLGEEYHVQLSVEAWLKDRTIPAEAASLLCAQLNQRAEKRAGMIDRVAKRRGLTSEALLRQIYKGTVPHMAPDDLIDSNEKIL